MAMFAVMVVPASAGVQRTSETRTEDAANKVKLVRDTALKAIKGVSSSGTVADYEAALVFAIDALKQPCDIVRDGLELAHALTRQAPAREAIRNVQQMCARLTGTGAVGNGVSTSIGHFGPGLGGGGGGGVGNYTPQN